MILGLKSYAEGQWVAGKGAPTEIASAVTGAVIAHANSDGLDMAAMLRFARTVGGPALRKLTFHQRADAEIIARGQDDPDKANQQRHRAEFRPAVADQAAHHTRSASFEPSRPEGRTSSTPIITMKAKASL